MSGRADVGRGGSVHGERPATDPHIPSHASNRQATAANRYLVREIKPGLWTIWDKQKACYWEASRDRYEIEALALSYNEDQRAEYPSGR